MDYLRALIELGERSTAATWPPLLSLPPAVLLATSAGPPASPVSRADVASATTAPVTLVGVPAQEAVDRALDVYEQYVRVDDGNEATAAALTVAALAETAEATR